MRISGPRPSAQASARDPSGQGAGWAAGRGAGLRQGVRGCPSSKPPAFLPSPCDEVGARLPAASALGCVPRAPKTPASPTPRHHHVTPARLQPSPASAWGERFTCRRKAEPLAQHREAGKRFPREPSGQAEAGGSSRRPSAPRLTPSASSLATRMKMDSPTPIPAWAPRGFPGSLVTGAGHPTWP